MQKIKTSDKIISFISTIRLIPHIILFHIHPKRSIIKYDVNRWIQCMKLPVSTQYGFIYVMTFYPEFRNLFYYRIGGIHHLIKWLCPKMNTLFLRAGEIGPGLFIQHGYATGVGAKSIGRDCWINQQVTIGFADDTGAPSIGDNVKISAGAIVIGNIHIGNNSQIGANSFVKKNVPENCIVVGVPAYICKRDGVKVKEKL